MAWLALGTKLASVGLEDAGIGATVTICPAAALSKGSISPDVFGKPMTLPVSA